MAAQFVCSLQVGCDWSRVLAFGLGLIVGLANGLLFQLTFVWTAYLLRKAVRQATTWGIVLAVIAGQVVVAASLLLPLVPLAFIGDRKAYISSAMWGALAGIVLQKLRERWRS